MDVRDLICYAIGCSLEVHELSTKDDGEPLHGRKIAHCVGDAVYLRGKSCDWFLPHGRALIVVESSIPLTALSEDQRAQAHTRFTLIRPALGDSIFQAQVARTHHISKSTIGRWVKRYREIGLAGLADVQVRSDKGQSRRLPAEAVTLIEGLALQTPPRTIAAIHRQVCAIAKDQRWNSPSYDSVSRIIKKLDPALLTLAHQGTAAYYAREYSLN